MAFRKMKCQNVPSIFLWDGQKSNYLTMNWESLKTGAFGMVRIGGHKYLKEKWSPEKFSEGWRWFSWVFRAENASRVIS